MVHRLPNPPPYRGGSCFAFFGRLSPSRAPSAPEGYAKTYLFWPGTPLLKPSEGRSGSAGAQGLCFEVGFFGRLSPSPAPRGEPDKRRGSSESPPRRAGSPRVSRRLAKGPVDAWPGERADHGGSAPVFQAQQESVAQEGEPRTFERCRTVKRRKRSWARRGAEGTPRVQARHRDGPCLDPLRRRGVQGTRWLLRAMAQAQMALGTLAETKVPRPPGRDPANKYRRLADTENTCPSNNTRLK